MPFGIPWKLIMFAGVAIAILGTIYAGYSYVTGLQDQVQHLGQENRALETAKDGLQKQIEQLKEIQKDIEQERDQASAVDRETEETIKSLKERLTDQTRQERERLIEESKKASLYLRFLQKYEECLALHFDDFTGKCNFRGEFREFEKGS